MFGLFSIFTSSLYFVTCNFKIATVFLNFLFSIFCEENGANKKKLFSISFTKVLKIENRVKTKWHFCKHEKVQQFINISVFGLFRVFIFNGCFLCCIPHVGILCH